MGAVAAARAPSAVANPPRGVCFNCDEPGHSVIECTKPIDQRKVWPRMNAARERRRRARVLVGPAIILTTIVLAFGLGVTVFSELPSLRTFGLV